MATKKSMLYKLWLNAMQTGSEFIGSQAFNDISLDERNGRRYIKSFEQLHPEYSGQPPNLGPECADCLDKKRLTRMVGDLKKELAKYTEEKLTTDDVKNYILELKDSEPPQPNWMLDPAEAKASVIPSIMLSDIHAGEVVFPSQVFGKNEYNMKICEARLKALCQNLIELLSVHINATYPGIVVHFNGDMLSGNIHEELMVTNEAPMMPVFVSLWGMLTEFLQTLIDEFGAVVVTATAGGNHTRTTKKTPAKNKAYTNFDWLLYRMLQSHFEKLKEDRITFHISDGDDIQFNIFDHRYRQTHGDQFKGGQGFIGAFAPITRNDKKKRAAADSYGMGYDTLLVGHFHSLMFLPKVIVNSSVIGFSEYSMVNNFEYEVPQQALFLTHYKRGITGRWPVFCDELKGKREKPGSLKDCISCT